MEFYHKDWPTIKTMVVLEHDVVPLAQPIGFVHFPQQAEVKQGDAARDKLLEGK